MQDEFGSLGGGRNTALEQKVQASRTALAVKSLTKMNQQLKSTTSAVSKLSKSLSGAASATRKTAKALRSLMSFDEINRLSRAAAGSSRKSSGRRSSSGSRSRTSGGKNGSGGRKSTEKGLETTLSTMKKLQGLKDWKAVKGFQVMMTTADQLAERLKGGLRWAYDNVLVPLREWSIKEGLPAAFEMLTGAISVLCGVLDVLAPIGREVWELFLAPMENWVGENIVSALTGMGDGFRLLYGSLEGLADYLNEGGPLERLRDSIYSIFDGRLLEGMKQTADNLMSWAQEQIFKPLSGIDLGLPVRVLIDKAGIDDFWNNMKEYWGRSKILTAAVQLVKDNWTSVKSWIGTVSPVSAAVKLAKSGWSSITGWIGTVNPLSVGVKLVKDGWKSVTSWLGSLTAKFNIKLPKIGVSWSGSPIPLPKFTVKWNAKGGILSGAAIFGRVGSTLLGGGEAGKEAVLPLERNTDWMDALADRVVNRMGSGQATGQPIVVQVTLDGRLVGQSTVNYINRQRRITGQSPIRL